MELKSIFVHFFECILSSQQCHFKEVLVNLHSSPHVPVNVQIKCSENIIQFAKLEKLYHSLVFRTTPKFFGKKEDLFNSYTSLLDCFERIQPKCPPVLHEAISLLSTCISMRQDFVRFYIHLVQDNLTFVLRTEALRRNILALELKIPSGYENIGFAGFFNSASFEISVVRILLRVQCEVSNLYFLDSIRLLKKCSLLLFEWREILQKSGAKAEGTELLQWYKCFHKALLAKTTLYWYVTFQKQSLSSAELDTASSKDSPNLLELIADFHAQSGCCLIALLFDAARQSDPFLGQGYIYPGTLGETPQGIQGYPAIFNYPPNFELENGDLYTAVMHISGKLDGPETETFTTRLHFYDERLQKTYFIARMEARVYLVITFEGQQAESDKLGPKFITALARGIRLYDVVETMKKHIA